MVEATQDRALCGIRVIDFTQRVAGPYCTKLLAGFGAEVVKIERPDGGDPERTTPPFSKACGDSADSISFLWLNTGKHSVTLDLKTSAGVAAALDLVRNADMVVENFSPGVMDRLGLGYDDLRRVNPDLIMLAISNFGQTGPYRDYKAEEIQLGALSGLMDNTGSRDREPLSTAPRLNQYTAGLHGYLALLMALEQREAARAAAAPSRGQYIDLSIMESSLEQIENRIHGFLTNGTMAKRGPHPFVPWGNFPCKDGLATVICAPFRHWPEGAKIFDDPLLARAGFYHLRARVEQRELINSHVADWASSHTRQEILHAGQDAGMSFGYVASLEEAFHCEQHRQRQFFTRVHHPDTGAYDYCDAPFRMAATPWQTTRSPRLGEHNAMMKEFRTRPAAVGREGFATGGSAEAAPLAGIRVVDLTHSWSGPHCTRLLADYGADVIKVEFPGRLCFFRGGITKDRAYDRQVPWHQINRNKSSVALDLKQAADLEYFRALVQQSDVVVSNSRPGVLETLGLGYADLADLNARIILIELTAFGASGPYANYCGYGAVMEGLSGIQSLSAYNGDKVAQRFREMDVINGIGGAAAVLTALAWRRRSGRGQHIDLSQMELPTHVLVGEQMLQLAIDGVHPQPTGNASPYFSPQGCYRCRGEDRWITISIRSPDEWKAFCTLFGGSAGDASELDREFTSLADDPRFCSNEQRLKNRAMLDDAINRWTSAWDHVELMARLQAAGIPAAAVLDVGEIAGNPQLRARGYFMPNESGDDGVAPREFVGLPFRLKSTRATARRGPALGEHTTRIAEQLLHLEPEQVPVLDESAIRTAYDY